MIVINSYSLIEDFDKSKGNIARLVNNYDINIKFNSAGQLEDMNLVIMETETYEGDDE